MSDPVSSARPLDDVARLARSAALMIVVLLTVTPPARAAPDPGVTIGRVASDLGLQTKLPLDPADPLKPEDEESSKFRIHLPAGLAEAILWSALIVGLAFVLYALRDTLPTRSRRTMLKQGALPVQPLTAAAVERMEETAAEADDLARQGKIAEAMHMLLLRGLVELRRRLDITIADSLTSREILHRISLPDSGRSALGDLIRRVEFAYFGAYASDVADYQACRASYDRLTGAMIAERRA